MAIDFKAVSEQSKEELLSVLPLKAGQKVGVRELVTAMRVVRAYDPHLMLTTWNLGPTEVQVAIGPAGIR